jgi:hypothetical protein
MIQSWLFCIYALLCSEKLYKEGKYTLVATQAWVALDIVLSRVTPKSPRREHGTGVTQGI